MNLNMNVLIVDDFATMRKIVRNVLKQIGFTNMTEAENGKAALKALKKDSVDLILCDWNMPEMSGIDLLKTLKSDDELKDIPLCYGDRRSSKRQYNRSRRGRDKQLHRETVYCGND